MDSPAAAATDSKPFALLAALERDFDVAERENLKHQIQLFRPLYARRKAVLDSIPGFWPMIFENFGSELDEHITVEDWAFLGKEFLSLDLVRFDEEIPESFDVVFTFRNGRVLKGKEEEKVEVRKRFEFKSMRDGEDRWTGFVSEPVVIEFEEGKDLTMGVNALAKKVFELRKKRALEKISQKDAGEKKVGEWNEKEKNEVVELEKELFEQLEKNQSFFNWFSWTGEYFMALDKEAELARRKAKEEKEGVKEKKEEDEDEEEEEDDGDDDEEGVDVFPDGEKIAYLISDDIFPNALKLFTDAMENQEAAEMLGSDDDDDDEDMEGSIDLEESEEDEKPAFKKNSGGKKRRNGHDEEKSNENSSKKSRK